MIVFFFSSRRRHTRCYRDWSSDVCSSDLAVAGLGSLWGVGAGAAFVALLPNISQSAPLIGSIHGQDVAFGIVVILVMLLLPTGFAGLLQRIVLGIASARRRSGGIPAAEGG